MATDNSTSLALQNQQFLSNQFRESFAPLNNFTSQNAQLSIAKQRAVEEQQFKIQTLAAQYDQSLNVAKFQAGHQDAVRLKDQADRIRTNQQARRVLKSEISQFPDSPEGNAKLIAAFNSKFSDPAVAEKIDLEDAVAITKQIKDTVGRLTEPIAKDSPQARQAVLKFLATPGVADMLVKKGKMTAAEVADIQRTGDPTKIAKVIDNVASEATLLWGQDRNVISQLTGAWNQALVESNAAPGPSQLVNADYLQMLMKRRDDIIGQKNITSEASWNSLRDAAGFTPAQIAKLPPPTSAGVGPTASAPVAAARGGIPQAPNPFTPPTPVQSGKVGLAKVFDRNPAGMAANAILREGNMQGLQGRDLAFTPKRIASDPYTELEARKRILQNFMENEQFTSGLSSAIPFVPNYQPKYDPYKQTKDEIDLETFVQGLYGPGGANLPQNRAP